MGDQPEPLLPNGVVAPILTPFEDDLSVSHDRFVAHAHRMLDEGCVGLAVFGTTGRPCRSPPGSVRRHSRPSWTGVSIPV